MARRPDHPIIICLPLDVIFYWWDERGWLHHCNTKSECDRSLAVWFWNDNGLASSSRSSAEFVGEKSYPNLLGFSVFNGEILPEFVGGSLPVKSDPILWELWFKCALLITEIIITPLNEPRGTQCHTKGWENTQCLTKGRENTKGPSSDFRPDIHLHSFNS